MLLEKKGRLAEANAKFAVADELSGGTLSEEEKQERRELAAKLQEETKAKELRTVNEEERVVSEHKKNKLTFSFFSEVVKSIIGDKDTLKEFWQFVKNTIKGKK